MAFIKPNSGAARRMPRTAALVVLLLLLANVGCERQRPTTPSNYCHNNLLQLEGAKKQWAEDNRKPPSAIPSPSDMFGLSRYIKIKPECPANGHYRIGAVGELPQCSDSRHQLQYLIMRRSHSWTQPYTCADNLRLIQAAKQNLVAPTNSSILSLAQVEAVIESERKYLKQSGLEPESIKLRCEAGGQYTVGSGNQLPQCSCSSNTARFP